MPEPDDAPLDPAREREIERLQHAAATIPPVTNTREADTTLEAGA